MTRLLPALALLLTVTAAHAQRDLSDLVRRAAPSVVYIETFDAGGQPIGLGSGFFVSDDGVIASNYHVIEGASRVTARTSDGRTVQVNGVIAFDADLDYAVLKVDGGRQRALRMSSYADTDVGEAIVVIGNPYGLEQSVSDGIVSQKRVMDGHPLIQFTAPISPGNSGGPVMDMDGKVIGIATMTRREGQNINFAVPIDVVRDALRSGADVRYSFDQLARGAQVATEQTHADALAANFSVFTDRSRRLRLVRANAWNADETQREFDTYTMTTVMLAPQTAERAEADGYLSEGIRVQLMLANAGMSWSQTLEDYVTETMAGLVEANPGFAVTNVRADHLGDAEAVRVEFVGENENISEPEKTVFLFVAQPRYRLKVELVSPASRLADNLPFLTALANSLELNIDE